MNTKEWYKKVNDAWPEDVPPLTFEAGANAAQRLHRFVTGYNYEGTFVETSGNRFSSYPKWGKYPINVEGHGPEAKASGSGWHDLIHDIAHYHWRKHVGVGQKPHAKGHARFELKLVKEVVKRGWLTTEHLDEPAPKPDPVDSKLADTVKKQDRVKAALLRWETKLKRAQTAIRKLTRKQAYYERRLDSIAG